ncbi:DUF4395 domain-containing protein [Demequina activiva]|uniref:Membrane protein n=1 Tax=Demequina activiva TaxID=1582364 RepID=A0A919Q500_9MICO|nr:DUF4395 domain-containing protein [Demequina activiva]GIG54996.1 membrane protein [Demequina activiva]
MSAQTQDLQIDPRGYRFGAGVTLVLALLALVLGATTAGFAVMALLALLFLPGATVGPQATVQAALFKRLVRPRIGAPSETESFRPPRFAQQMGLAMSTAALVLGLLGLAWGFWLFAALVTVASFLNAVFEFCLGCEIYLLLKRAGARAA